MKGLEFMVYTYEEAREATLDYFDGNDLATSVFLNKYALRNEENELLEKTPDDMHHRIAKELARIEKSKFKNPLTENDIYELLKDFKRFIPAGSCMFGVGNEYQTVSLANCLGIPAPLDSFGSIHQIDEYVSQLSKRRCGIGFSISNLRPIGTATQNAAKTSSGIITFMERYSSTIRQVGQKGRRGALLLMLNVHHPQIIDFIHAKQDLAKVTGANISVQITDDFMKAVRNNDVYEQRWPINDKNPKISNKVNARDVWNEIVKCARNTAEPGVLFWDTVQRESPADCYKDYGFETTTTNACLPSWSNVLTPNGIKKISDIAIGDLIWSETEWTMVVNKKYQGKQDVFEYETNAGVFYSTKDHKVVQDGEKVEVQNAKKIDILSGLIKNKDCLCLSPSLLSSYKQDIMDGLVIGDGSKHKASNYLVYLHIGANDYDYFDSEIAGLIGRKRDAFGETAYEIKTTIDGKKELPCTYDRFIPDRFIYNNSINVCAFLRGLFSANGCMSGPRVTLKAASKKLVRQVQFMLSSVGIKSYITTNKSNNIKWNNGVYKSKQSYDINITSDIDIFYNRIGFIQKYKSEKLEEILNKRDKQGYRKTKEKSKISYEINHSTKIGKDDVYDITVHNKSHTFWCNGFNISNCSELPLNNWGACLLGSLNMFSYVNDPFTNKSSFDYNSFKKDSILAQRLMDDLIDIEIEKINSIIKKIKNDPEPKSVKATELELWQNIKDVLIKGRRTGLGATGLGDTIAALGYKYGSPKSIEIADKIYETLKLGAYRSSVNIAKELGAFPIFDAKLERKNPFLNRIKNEDKQLYSDMESYGRRNIACLTSAPTGSLSILSGTSSGIEPLYQMKYKRRKKINNNDKGSRVDYIDQNGDKWQEYDVIHPKVKLWQSITNKDNLEKSPWHNCCAEDLDWKQRVKMQATIQRHIDSAISSTINCPEDITNEEVSNIYMLSWEMGLKGITIYRKGSRSGVLIDSSQIQKTKAPKRPKVLPCEVFHPIVLGKPYTVLIGLYNNEPYEVFVTYGHNLSKDTKTGKIIKIKRGHYKAELEHNYVIEDLMKNATPTQEAITRLVSTALRHGSSVEFIAQQLDKAKGNITSFEKALARTLRKMIKDGTSVTGDNCEKCGGKLIYQGGCVICSMCGYSICG